jgi:hypothetical protein
MQPPLNLSLKFETVILPYNGRSFCFVPAPEQPAGVLECHVCYWRGQVRPTADGGFEAAVEQKYPPYTKTAAPQQFETRLKALQWVAEQLQGEA